MTETQNELETQTMEAGKARIIAIGVGLGAMVGLISSYLYARAAEESEKSEAGAARSVSASQLLGVLLTTLGLIRQIADLGKPKDSGKPGK